MALLNSFRGDPFKVTFPREPPGEERHGLCSYDSATIVPGFTATLLKEEGGTPIVSVFGEVDLCNAHDLDILMLKAVAEAGEGGSVIVDLAGVEFMDLSGLKVLIRARSILEDSPDGSLTVVCGGQVRRLFESAGLTKDFELYPDLCAAVEPRSRPRLVS